MADTVQFLTERGVPVMGYVGLMPQSVNTAGGFKVQGRGQHPAERVLVDAKAIAEAGAFSLVIEGTVEPVARAITASVPIPTIGIGASPVCDGQILVTEDVLGSSRNSTALCEALCRALTADCGSRRGVRRRCAGPPLPRRGALLRREVRPAPSSLFSLFFPRIYSDRSNLRRRNA